ncbi:MAG: hypothetical protein L0332_31645 [Chloroflexi bacterium]|nr:hypothetical protein [Chloroflexota bacterium]MCI0579779.1 hypothetical protein [Chloroflexota bacterium]MCI0649151.1 hypothetical protein [Chloroflexota bacterium]MCI0731257.1 hypothetical protein [Chloroflexota bacterium]
MSNFRWEKIEAGLGARLVQVYGLPLETARVDTTTVAVYHDEEESGQWYWRWWKRW